MKRYLCIALFLLLLFSLSSCSTKKECYTEEDVFFTQMENGNLLSPWGTEYAFLCHEGILYYFGDTDMTFLGGVLGEETENTHLGGQLQTGLFSITDQEDPDILIYRTAHSEWKSIYRKADLPSFDYSIDNCNRFEFVVDGSYFNVDEAHKTCGKGLTDKAEIEQFLTDIRAQQDPREAGLYDMIKKPNGLLENCYVCGYLYGYYAEEPNLIYHAEIISFNDLAYSIRIENREYVLPGEWLVRLQAASS